jgi:hypothetical protein
MFRTSGLVRLVSGTISTISACPELYPCVRNHFRELRISGITRRIYSVPPSSYPTLLTYINLVLPDCRIRFPHTYFVPILPFSHVSA